MWADDRYITAIPVSADNVQPSWLPGWALFFGLGFIPVFIFFVHHTSLYTNTDVTHLHA